MAATTATATAPAAATAATVAPWRDAREWLAVKQQLAAPTAPAHAQQQGLRRVAAWKARGRLPLAVECTAGLVAAQLQDRSPPARAAAGDTAARHSVRQTYAMALVRFVNGFADAAQRRVAARRVHAAAAELGLPAWLVDLRHDATHGALPGLPILRRACQTALQWLREVYWQPQAEAARSRQTAARAHLRTFAALRREARAPRDGTADDDVQRARQHKSRGLQALEAVAQLYPPDQVSALAEVLLGRELLLQPPPPPPVLTEGVTEAETLKQVVADWKPALAFFAARAPALASWLLHSLLERLLVAAEDESSGDQGNEDLGVALIATWCSVVLQLAGGHIGEPGRRPPRSLVCLTFPSWFLSKKKHTSAWTGWPRLSLGWRRTARRRRRYGSMSWRRRRHWLR